MHLKDPVLRCQQLTAEDEGCTHAPMPGTTSGNANAGTLAYATQPCIETPAGPCGGNGSRIAQLGAESLSSQGRHPRPARLRIMRQLKSAAVLELEKNNYENVVKATSKKWPGLPGSNAAFGMMTSTEVKRLLSVAHQHFNATFLPTDVEKVCQPPTGHTLESVLKNQ